MLRLGMRLIILMTSCLRSCGPLDIANIWTAIRYESSEAEPEGDEDDEEDDEEVVEEGGEEDEEEAEEPAGMLCAISFIKSQGIEPP